MAHEIAHVAARHATKNMTQVGDLEPGFDSADVRWRPGRIRHCGNCQHRRAHGFLKFSRDAEREADLLGLEYDYAAGYDPAGLCAVLREAERRRENQARPPGEDVLDPPDERRPCDRGAE